jgi:hypothetical protein
MRVFEKKRFVGVTRTTVLHNPPVQRSVQAVHVVDEIRFLQHLLGGTVRSDAALIVLKLHLRFLQMKR